MRSDNSGLIKHIATCLTVCCALVCSTISTKAATGIASQGKIKVGSTILFDCDDIANLDFTSPAASGTTTSFIDSVSQADGKVTATKKTIPNASASTAGVVKLNDTLTSSSTTEALTANQGKVLKGSIDEISNSLDGCIFFKKYYAQYSVESKHDVTIKFNCDTYDGFTPITYFCRNTGHGSLSVVTQGTNDIKVNGVAQLVLHNFEGSTVSSEAQIGVIYVRD